MSDIDIDIFVCFNRHLIYSSLLGSVVPYVLNWSLSRWCSKACCFGTLQFLRAASWGWWLWCLPKKHLWKRHRQRQHRQRQREEELNPTLNKRLTAMMITTSTQKARILNQTISLCLFYDSFGFVVYATVKLLFDTMPIHSARKNDQKNLLGQLSNARNKLLKHEKGTKVLDDMTLTKLKDKIAPRIILMLFRCSLLRELNFKNKLVFFYFANQLGGNHGEIRRSPTWPSWERQSFGGVEK